jgi:hypothetical protein
VIPRLRLRQVRASSAAAAYYVDGYGDRWERREEMATCTRCGHQAVAPYRNPEKRGAYCHGCVSLWARPRTRGPFRPPAEIGPGGRVERCRRCRRPLERDGARASGYGHTCEDARTTDNQLALALGDERQPRAR